MTYAQSLAMCKRFAEFNSRTDKETRWDDWCLEYCGLRDAERTPFPCGRTKAYLRGFERGKAQLAFEAWAKKKGIAI